MLKKLSKRVELDAGDHAAVLGLPYRLKLYHPTSYIVREGAPPPLACGFIASGVAFRQKLTADGTRQIVSIHLPGDFIDIEHLFLNLGDHNVQALSEVQAVNVDRNALQKVILERPAIARAMWIDALVNGSIFREWIVNVGRRDARSKIAHLLCETALRMEEAGLIESVATFEFPLTQEQLADAVGLTNVHVNRTLRTLVADGVLTRNRRHIAITDWDKLKSAADFNGLYLHFDQESRIVS
jgi:CRP-like cAMP-binding protein